MHMSSTFCMFCVFSCLESHDAPVPLRQALLAHAGGA